MGCSHATPRNSLAQAHGNSQGHGKSCKRISLSHAMENGKLIPSGGQETFREQWRVLHKLGEGHYAEVYEVKYKSSGRCAALKLPKDTCSPCDARKEARIWKKISRHEHIVNVIDHFVIDGKVAILMEKCDRTLGQHIYDFRNAGQTDTAQFFLHMTAALAHLESLSIVHRDIKPDNFLCCDDVKALKLCDFGFAALMPKSGRLFGTFGTPFFMSPEMVGDGSHNLQTDVWSLGATFYLMLYGEHPYSAEPQNSKNVMLAISTGFPEPRYQSSGNVSPTAKDGVAAMLNRSIHTRLLASQVLEMPFLKLTSGHLAIKRPLETHMGSVGMEMEIGQTTTCGTSSNDDISLTCSHVSCSQPQRDHNSPCIAISL